MLRIRKALCIFLMALLLTQPVFAETEAPTQRSPDIVTAVHSVETLPRDLSPLAAPRWLLDLTTAPLYTMTNNGSWAPVLAESLPEDVTADFAGTYGIPAGAQRGYAFRILLRGDACWEDGTPITADDCLFSIRTLLESEETAEDWMFLAGAQAILSGKSQPDSEIISLRDANFPGVSEAWSAGYTDFYVDLSGFWGLDGGWKSVSDRTRLRDYAMPGGLDEYFVTPAYLYNNYLMDGAQSSYYQSEFIGICREPGEALTMEDLGLVKVNDSELILILQEPAAPSTLMQQLESLFLFREDADQDISYGPYRITSANSAQIVLEPNPNWWGAADPRGYDRIFCQKIGS